MVEGASKLFEDLLQKMHDPRDLALKCLLTILSILRGCHCVAKQIARWLKICSLFLVYSQIWLNLLTMIITYSISSDEWSSL